MDKGLFLDMLRIDSTSGKERRLADFLAEKMAGERRCIWRQEVPAMSDDYPEGYDVPVNLFVTWGNPKVVFCSHLDTVPPYIAPVFEEGDDPKVYGRGTCDAKGQIFAMWNACLELERRGYSDFGLLLLAGEETGSFGAKTFSTNPLRAVVPDDWVMISKASSDAVTGPGICADKYGKDDRSPMPLRAVVPDDWVIIVGEPTDNFMTSASKGTKSFEVTFKGEAFHSGYPQYGSSAVEMFGDFLNALRSIRFPEDSVLGDTTWNIGRLVSDNPQNILSDSLSCRVYFRTTEESDEMVCNIMRNMAGPQAKLRFGRKKVQDGSDLLSDDVAPWQKAMSVKEFGGDSPTRYEVLDGFASKPVAFGSDAPQLKCFTRKILYGPGSILVAHRDDEHIRLNDIEKAVEDYVTMYLRLTGR